ncbi:MAG: hypothetical protein RLZZ148_2509 [Cyanobacteriota bacterium]
MTKAAFVQGTEFDELLTNAIPIVVDFTATWCGPCRVIAPLIDQLAKEYEATKIPPKNIAFAVFLPFSSLKMAS